MTLEIFKKNAHITPFMSLYPEGAELFNADERTDMAKLTVAYSNFTRAHKEAKLRGQSSTSRTESESNILVSNAGRDYTFYSAL
jgi:hypothetical protein